MRGASADSLAALVDEVGPAKGLVPKVREWASDRIAKVTGHADDDDGSSVERMADDLFGVAGVLRREASLRRTLTDASLPAEPKVGLVRQIFGEALAENSLDLVATAVSRRWAAPRDLADALEYVGVVCVVKAAELRGEADVLEDQLFGYGRMVADNPELRDALSDPARSTADKRALLQELLGDRATSGTLRLAQQSVAGSHRTVALAVEAYQKIVADHRERLVATVRVARELSDEEAGRLARALERQYGLPVHLNMMIDREVIGGIRVEIGDDVIDGTVSSRLDDARRRLAG
jgi:F-type H+-transporting ATPase subunit delta